STERIDDTVNNGREQMLRIGLGTLFALTVATRAFAADITWDLSTEYNQQHFLAGGYKAFAETLKEESGGTLDVFVQWGGALGYKSSDHFSAVSGGAVPLADTTASALTGINALFGLSSAPFTVADIEEARAMFDIARPYYEKIFDEHEQ